MLWDFIINFIMTKLFISGVIVGVFLGSALTVLLLGIHIEGRSADGKQPE